MKVSSVIFSLLAGAQVEALLEPTNAAADAFQVMGMSPRPTGHLDLLKRLSQEYTVCGYVDGDPRIPLDCAVVGPNALCGVDDTLSWVGCCTSYSTVSGSISPVSCPSVTACVPYSRLSSCTGSCASDTLLKKCTDSRTPYCGAYIISIGQTYAGYGCATTQLPVLTLLPTITGGNATSARSSSITASGFVLSGSSSSSSSSSITSRSSTSSTSAASGAGTTVSRTTSSAMAVQTGAPMGLGLAGAVLVVLKAL